MKVDYERIVNCFQCDAPILMSESRYKHLLRSKEYFYCCNGHSQHFTGQTDDQKKIVELEREIAALKRDISWANDRMRALCEEAALFKCLHPRCRFTHKVRKVVFGHMKDCRYAVAPKRLPKDAGPNAKNTKVWQS